VIGRHSIILAVTLATAACAPQQVSQQGGTPGASEMQGHDMPGMDMPGMMAHCAQMRRQRAQGQSLSPDMQAMMAHCDEMDRSMGTGTPAAPMPGATRSR
jgi:hypothetical protein